MTDEFFLTPTDLAEALGCTRLEVLDLVAAGELAFEPGHGRRVAHSAVEAFVTRHRDANFALGRETELAPRFASSRPFNDDRD